MAKNCRDKGRDGSLSVGGHTAGTIALINRRCIVQCTITAEGTIVETLSTLATVQLERTRAGHSKGNLVLSEALYAIADDRPDLAHRLRDQVRIVTISAKVGMPLVFTDVVDIMGGWDCFGALNSRPDIPA